MSLTKNRLAALAACAALFSAASAALADAIIVRSTGPSAKLYPPGKSVPETARIALQAGDTLTVLSTKGTAVLKGPGSFSPTGSSAATGSSLAMFLSNTGARQVRAGATRGVGNTGPVHRPNLWYVDVATPGNVCVLDAASPALWRADTSAAGTVTITSSSGKSATADFREGQAVRAWPVADLPVADGDRFTLSGAGLAQGVTIRVRALPAGTDGADAIAAALVRNGCDAQVSLLADVAEQMAAADAN